ncbi:MAG: peptide-methionine (S)-S-oxide reductase MsrA [Candidatus Latescibacteria bacterium]|nr:peptide-methionine (S)-S-oxide reductase MsrA [Candidatus Latescibacterota bacterium]
MSQQTELATLGGGCFWCVEAIYQDLKGVAKVVSGYAGGQHPAPTYQEVCAGTTGHAEVIQIHFDPQTISFDDLLYVFWRTHDPTTLNRQGADSGTQYRSVILYHSEAQKSAAIAALSQTEASDLWDDPIVTEIAPFSQFFPGEAYHQNFYKLNPNQPYCRAIIDPKMSKFRKAFADRLDA